jgi:DNA polymerase III epsilon subunit-like protein
MTDVRPLVILDLETTGLDPARHQAWEVAWWNDDDPEPRVGILPHTLENADSLALEIGRYHERGIEPSIDIYEHPGRFSLVAELQTAVTGATIVGANPGFDLSFLRVLLPGTPWHYRPIDVETMAMTVWQWERPRGLDAIARHCADEYGCTDLPDHSAEGDVRATRAVYHCIRDEMARIARAARSK